MKMKKRMAVDIVMMLSWTLLFYLQNLYDLMMDMLDERGINEEFANQLIEFSTAYEHSKYLAFLKDLKSFAEKWDPSFSPPLPDSWGESGNLKVDEKGLSFRLKGMGGNLLWQGIFFSFTILYWSMCHAGEEKPFSNMLPAFQVFGVWW